MSKIKKIATIFLLIIALLLIGIAIMGFIMEIYPTSGYLILQSLPKQIKNNEFYGSAEIEVKANVDLSQDLGQGTKANIDVKNKIEKIKLKDDKSYIQGGMQVDYADLASNNNYYIAYGNKDTTYLYYSDEKIPSDYELRYDSWCKLKKANKTSGNFAKDLKNILKKVENKSLNRDKMIIYGNITSENLASLWENIENIDPQNVAMIQGISNNESASVKIQFDKKSQRLTSIELGFKNVSAASNSIIEYAKIKINVINSGVDKIKVPDNFDSKITNTQYNVSEPIETPQTEYTDTNEWLQDYHTVGLLLDGKRVDLKTIKDVIYQNRDYVKWSLSKDSNLLETNLTTDSNAKIYLYTDETNEVTQIEFDNSYAKNNTLKVMIAGLTFGTSKDETIQKLGEPAKSISGDGKDELTYYIGQKKEYELTLDFYTETKTINGGLQKINLLINTVK